MILIVAVIVALGALLALLAGWALVWVAVMLAAAGTAYWLWRGTDYEQRSNAAGVTAVVVVILLVYGLVTLMVPGLDSPPWGASPLGCAAWLVLLLVTAVVGSSADERQKKHVVGA